MVKKLNKIDSWSIFFKSFNRLHQKMEEDMKEVGHPSLEIYDVLWTLEQAPDHQLRFKELGKKVFISRCHVTRISERLELLGHLKRIPCEDDKRGVWAQLTPSGLQLRKVMWTTYQELIHQYFSQHLSLAEHEQLITILQKVYPSSI